MNFQFDAHLPHQSTEIQSVLGVFAGSRGGLRYFEEPASAGTGFSICEKLASEWTEKLRNRTTVDWLVRESVRVKMRILIGQLLWKYKYPPEG